MGDVVETAFRRHYAQVHRFLRARTRDSGEADDLAQDVFADAARSLDADGGPVLAWSYTVAKRRFADEARRRARVVTLAEARRTSAEYGPDVAHALREALDELPLAQRHVVVMKLINGASFAEIASTTGITVDAAKMRFSRGLKSMRAALEEKGVEP